MIADLEAAPEGSVVLLHGGYRRRAVEWWLGVGTLLFPCCTAQWCCKAVVAALPSSSKGVPIKAPALASIHTWLLGRPAGCAHNPTGVDPTHEQWEKIADVIVKKNHLPVSTGAVVLNFCAPV